MAMRKIEISIPNRLESLGPLRSFRKRGGTRDELYTYAQDANDAAKLAVRSAQLWKGADDAEKDGDFKADLRFAEAAATGNAQETKLRVRQNNRRSNEKTANTN
jgi:hypothetical protein